MRDALTKLDHSAAAAAQIEAPTQQWSSKSGSPGSGGQTPHSTTLSSHMQGKTTRIRTTLTRGNPKGAQTLTAFRPLQDGAELETTRGHRHIRPHTQEGLIRRVGQATQGHQARRRQGKVLGGRWGTADGHSVEVPVNGTRGNIHDTSSFYPEPRSLMDHTYSLEYSSQSIDPRRRTPL